MTDPAPVQKQSNDNLANSWTPRIRELASFVRDVGVIIGIPLIIGVGLQLRDIQQKSFETQVKANEANIKALEAQNAFLKETQFDRALSLIKSQNEMFRMERAALMKQISDLQEYQGQNEQFLKKITEDTLEHSEAIEMVRKDPTLGLSRALEEVRRKKIS